MPSGVIEISTSVAFRDEMGRFASACEEAAQEALAEIANDGENSAQQRAPEIAESIHGHVSGNEAVWYSDHQWAMAFEHGIPPHVIARKNARALASKERGFGPVAGPVNHPGMAARAFLRGSYAQVAPTALSIFAKHFPG